VFFPENAPPLLQALQDLWGGHTLVFIASLLIALLLTPVFRALAIGLGIYDMPDQRLKPHSRPIPYLGGLAIFLGVGVPLAAVSWGGHVEHSGSLWAVLVGLTIIVIAGLLDDLIGLRPYQKIIAQVAAALALVAGGIIFRAIPWEIGGVQWIPNRPALLLSIGVVFQVFLVVAACNATNLLDGLDGLCGGVTAIIAIGFLLLATSIAGWHEWGAAPSYQFATLIIVISLALLGTALGFLPYNFNPASIFMGDAGSMLLGFVCATLMIMFSERQGMIKWFVGALFIFGLPIFDTALAYARRKLNGRPIFQGDRSHFYDQLVDRGLTVRQTVLICYGLALFFAAMGVGIIFMRTRYGLLVYCGVATILAVSVYKAGMLRVDTDETSARNPAGRSQKEEGPV
jgi:UDP-GlcNAc:undecaprenyl-phosphate GlcNAc-1-phosphate transferase